MATWIIGGIIAVAVSLVIRQMVKDKRAGKSGCSCGGDCSRCGGCNR